ncbi:MAG: rod shape-determining protein [Candidatus Brocadiaceae bacterium]|nr:rod shape-determining protein [Candidatus Brocadiaceae bacterium]
MSFGALDLGIDLGTANTLVCVPGKGLVLIEPSVVAIKTGTNPPSVPLDGRAVGNEAKRMIERTPENIRAIRPLKDGVIADFEITEIMLRYFIQKVQRRSWGMRPRLLISVPSGVTAVQKEAVKNSGLNAGARKVYTVAEPKAGAIGAGLQISEPVGSMIIDIGGGTSEVAVMSLGEIVTLESLNVAGDEMDDAIINYVREMYGLEIGHRTAEEVKIAIGSAYPLQEEVTYEIRGKDIAAGLPRRLEISSAEIREAISRPVLQIIDAAKSCLDRTPPELASDLLDTGITVVGGGALIPGLSERMAEESGLPVRVADDPLTAVARGTALLLERIDEYESVLAD